MYRDCPAPLLGHLGFLLAFLVLLLVLGQEGDPEPVDITGHVVWLPIAETEAEGLVELSGLIEVLHDAGHTRDAVDLHRLLLLTRLALGNFECFDLYSGL
jgi:hypothetical protein